MSEWKQKADDPTWFEEKMTELLTAIESEENIRFTGEIERLRRIMPGIRYDTSKQSGLLRQPFYGRNWLKNKIDEWRLDPQGARLCILYGDPGIGKSAFAAHYMHYYQDCVAAVFCEYSRQGFNDPRTVIQTLAYLLACRFPDYRLILCDLLEDASYLSSMNASEQFDVLIANPFSTIMIDRDIGAYCILIDGLDECGSSERNVLTEIIVQYADRLPDWLRILATSRRVTGVTGPSFGSFHIDMDGGDDDNIRDIEDFFRDQLYPEYKAADTGERLRAEICRSLAEKSGGIFLYAVMMEDAIRRKKVDPNDLQSYPDGLGNAFYQWFQWFFPDRQTYDTEIGPVLSMILASPEPLPDEEIALSMNWTRKKTADVIRHFSVLLKTEERQQGKRTVAISHKFIADWLCSPAAGIWQVDPIDGAAVMAEAFYEICREEPEDLSDYEALWLRSFLQQCGKKKEVRRLKENIGLRRRLLDTGIRYSDREDHKNALQYLQEAAAFGTDVSELSEKTLAEDPKTEDFVRLVADICNELGMELEALGNTGDLALALQYYKNFQQAADRLFAWKKTEPYALMAARAAGRIGDGYRKYGTVESVKKAIDRYHKREMILSSFIQDHPSGKVREAFVSTCRQLLKAYMQLEDEESLSVALAYADKCVRQTELLNDPETAGSLCYRGYAFYWTGEVQLARAGKNQVSLSYADDALSRAVKDFEKAEGLDDCIKHRRALAQGLFKLGEVYMEIGTPEKNRAAVAVYERCKRKGEELWASGKTPERLRELALVCRALGLALQRVGDPGSLERAKACFEESLDYSQKLTEWIDLTRYRRDLAVSYGRLAEITELTAVNVEDLRAALSYHEESLKVLQGIPAGRQLGNIQYEIAVCEERIGDLLTRHRAEIDNISASFYYHSALLILEKSDIVQKKWLSERLRRKLDECDD